MMLQTFASVTATTSEARQTAGADLPSQVWFACCCIALPVLWGVVVHLVFRRLRGKGQPEREQEAGWPDYQI
ncbi:MAG: hypothetical protein ABGZ53_35620 [Fuerstiella sp.]